MNSLKIRDEITIWNILNAVIMEEKKYSFIYWIVTCSEKLILHDNWK